MSKSFFPAGTAELTDAQASHITKTLDAQHSSLVVATEDSNSHSFLTQQFAEAVLQTFLPRMLDMLSEQDGDGLAVVIGNGDGEVLLIYLNDDPSKWNYDYLDIALSKFEMAYHHRCNTREIPAHLIHMRDTVYIGGVYWKGLPIAVSAFAEEEDEDWGEQIGKALEHACDQRKIEWRATHIESDFYE
jgi:hypothetical protein